MESSREYILQKLKKAEASKKAPVEPDFSIPVFPESGLPAITEFKNNIEAVSGYFFPYQNEADLYNSLKKWVTGQGWETVACLDPGLQNKLSSFGIPFSEKVDYSVKLDAAITSCECLVSQTGSILMSSAMGGGRRMFAFPENHIVFAQSDQLVRTLNEAYNLIAMKYKDNLPSQITLVTGPSRTADIEKTLVMGAHGPKNIYVFFLE